ncbi:hypothetical protein A6302_04134 [Methylobrevis pamukkalensis]|uniref:Uncharacterized protein n=1 Tax=Methylobrevis pamukkalensis TaxID=1439726 RepID=A0A1E3GZ33_9HYPH|nr:hypothetical protein A6302_04134 [Methylobrevis pamukkalensis]
MNTPRKTDFEAGRGYTRDDWDEVSDTPDTSEQEMGQARPFAEVFPALGENLTASTFAPLARRSPPARP